MKQGEWEAAFSFLRARHRSYLLLKSPAARPMLEDLARFCRANETCWDPDPSKKDVLIGRNEMWIRIQQHLNLTPEELWALYGGPPKPEENQDNA